MKNMRLADLLLNRPLMITEGKLNAILHVVGPRFNLDLSAVPAPGKSAAMVSDQDRRRAGYTVDGGVGVIGIYGPLLHRLMADEYPSGGPTTYGDICRAFNLALADDAVTSIVLDIDSPGGEVYGVFDLAEQIYQARSVKPITALINEQACSAAYLVASAAGRIVIPRTGDAGSIGVRAMHADFSRMEDAAGITVTHIYAGARKVDFSPHMPLSPEALAIAQTDVEETYGLFCETVARNRGMSVKAVRETEAGIFSGKKAVALKLADEVASVAASMDKIRKKSPSMKFAASAATRKEKNMLTIEQLREEHTELVAQIETAAREGMIAQTAADTARAEAVTAETARVVALAAAAFGEEPGKKFGAVVGRGLSAEDLSSLGITFAAETVDVDAETRGKILAALTAAAPQGLKTGRVEQTAATATVDTSAIYASRQGKKP